MGKIVRNKIDYSSGNSRDNVLVAEYNVTTSQELRAYLDSTKEPFAPIVIKRGNDYYTSILSAKNTNNDSVTLRVLGSGSGDFHLFTYTVTDNVWANNGYTLQKKLTAGTGVEITNNVISTTPVVDSEWQTLQSGSYIRKVGSQVFYSPQSTLSSVEVDVEYTVDSIPEEYRPGGVVNAIHAPAEVSGEYIDSTELITTYLPADIHIKGTNGDVICKVQSLGKATEFNNSRIFAGVLTWFTE